MISRDRGWSWCPPCQRMGEVLSSIEEQFDGIMKIAKVNIDRNPMVSSKFDVVGVPSFVFFKDGKIVHREVGARSEKQLKDVITRMFDDD